MSLWAACALALGGCEGAHWANFVTLGVTATLFFGTLNLGRRARADVRTNDTAATASTSPAPRR